MNQNRSVVAFPPWWCSAPGPSFHLAFQSTQGLGMLLREPSGNFGAAHGKLSVHEQARVNACTFDHIECDT